MQRHLRVGAVVRLAPLVGFDIDRISRRDERRDVGDRVVHDEPALALAVPLDVERLIEVHRGRWIDGDELQLGAVQLRQPRRGSSPLGRGGHLGRETLGKFLFDLDPFDPCPQYGGK